MLQRIPDAVCIHFVRDVVGGIFGFVAAVGHGDGGADDHALKIQIHRGEEIGEHIPHHHVEFGAGDIVVRPPQKRNAAHHQHRQDDPQDVDEPPALMPDQRDVGDAQCQGEQQHEGSGEDHEGLGISITVRSSASSLLFSTLL